MFRSVRAGLGAVFAGALVASMVAFAAPSGAVAPAGPAGLTPSFPEGVFQGGTLRSVVVMSAACDANVVASNVTILKAGVPTTDATVVELGQTGSFGLLIGAGAASTPGSTNQLDLSLACLMSSTPVTLTGTISWAQIDVTKTVVGGGTIDGDFEITAVCSAPTAGSVGAAAISPAPATPTTLTLPLGAGETGSVFAVSNGTCDFTETNTLGALESAVTPGSITISSSTTQTVSVVNTFATPRFTG